MDRKVDLQLDVHIHTHHGILITRKNKIMSYITFRRMDGIVNHHVKHDKTSSKNQKAHVFTHLWNLDLE
jgi:hypothetical protein